MPRRISAKARFAKLARANASPSNLPRGPYAGFNGGGYGGAYGGRWVNPLLPGARKDWLGAAGDLWRNSVVAACLGWLTDNFTDAILGTYAKGTPGEGPEPSPYPALEDLIGPAGTPNPWYTTDELWAATVLSYKVDGNAFWIIVPGSGGAGEPVELWWEPHFTVTPWRAVGSPNLVDKYYLWRPEGNVELDPSQVVHFRDGLDPRDPTRGMSRLKHAARNIVGLNDAETYTASIIGNLGALGVVWMPEGGPGDMADVDEKDALAVAKRLRQQMSRENAGKIGAINLPGKFERIGLGPQEMSLESILDRPEATVCAVLGVSAQSIGLAVGNNTRTFTNLKESDKLSWKNGLIPAQNRMARQLTHQLLPRFFDVPEGLHLGWDRSQVEALQQDAQEAATAATTLAGGAILTADEARARFFKMPPLANGEGESITGPPMPDDQGEGDQGDEGEEPATKARSGGGAATAKAPKQANRKEAGRKPSKREKTARQQPGRKPGQYEESKHPRAAGGKFASKPGSGDRKVEHRHVRLERAAARATAHHEGLKKKGITGDRYHNALDRAIRLKRAADIARSQRAKELFGLRSGGGRTQGRLELKPGEKGPRQAPGRHTPERAGAAEAIRKARRRLQKSEARSDAAAGTELVPVAPERHGVQTQAAAHRQGKGPDWARTGYALARAKKEFQKARRNARRSLDKRDLDRAEPHVDRASVLSRRVARLTEKYNVEINRGEGGNPKAPRGSAANPIDATPRTNPAGPDPSATADHPPGFIGEVKTDLIHFDPSRFQYKLAQTDHSTGSVGSLAGVRKWDPELAGVVSVWKDHADGKTYVVNGHNRLDLAKSLGVDKVAVRYLDAPDATWARAKGALANIAEGRGTSIDAAKFFRDAKITSKGDLQDRGIPLSEAKTGEGLALAGLNNPLFGRVIDGTLKTSHGAIIGGAGLSHESQSSVAEFIDKQKGRLNEGEIRELADDAKHAGSRTKDDGPGLFGKDEGPDEESLLLHRVKLIAGVKQRLGREKNLFGTVGRKKAAETLARAGNVIDAEASGAVSRDAAEALHVFDSLKRTSLFSGIVNDHAEKMAGARGDKARRQVEDDLYDQIRTRVKDAYDLGK